MSDIGNFLRPEDSQWHHLSVDGFGEFTVRAKTTDAAWLTLSYFCIEMGLGYDPEQQLEMLHSATTMPADQAVERNRARFLTRSTGSVIVDYRIENGERPAPQQSDYALGTRASMPTVV